MGNTARGIVKYPVSTATATHHLVDCLHCTCEVLEYLNHTDGVGFDRVLDQLIANRDY